MMKIQGPLRFETTSGEAIDGLIDDVEYYAGHEDPMSNEAFEGHIRGILEDYYQGA